MLRNIIVLLGLFLPTVSFAAECTDWNSDNVQMVQAFWAQADAAAIETCINDVGLDQKNNQGLIPIHYAAALAPSGELMKVMLAADNQSFFPGRPLMSYAAQYNPEPSVMAALIDSGKFDVNEDFNGFRAINVAAQYNNHGVIKALIDGGADVNVRTDEGFPPIMNAVLSNPDPLAICVLGAAGADFTFRHRSWNLAQIAQSNNPAILPYVQEFMSGAYTSGTGLCRMSGY